MPAIQQHSVWTGFLSPTSADVAAGSCMTLDAAGTYVVVATSVNRTAASRTTASIGIAITDASSTNRTVEIQTVGPCPPEITGLGAGSATNIIVNASGLLERKAIPSGSDVVAGKCDADGWAYLNFSARDTAGDSLPEGWTDEGSGRLHARSVEMGNGAALLTFSAAAKTITRDSGTFTDDGFVVGDFVVVDGTLLNDGVYTITDLTGGSVMTVAESLVNESVGSTNIYLYTQSFQSFGPLNGTIPQEGYIRVDSGKAGKLIVASYNGEQYNVLQQSGASTYIGDTFPVDATVQFYCGTDGIIQANGHTIVQGDFEQNGNCALLGPDQGDDWESGLRVLYLYGVNAGVVAPTANPTNGMYLWCKNGNDSTTALWSRYPNGVIRANGGRRVEHQDGRLTIVSLAGQTTTASTSPTAITQLSYTQPDETVCTYDFVVTCSRSTNSTKGGTYKGTVTYRRTSGGAPTLVGAAVYQTDQETTAGDGVLFAVSSNDVRPQVTAADTDGRGWGGEMRIQQMAAA